MWYKEETFENIKRVKEIAQILSKYGFDDLVERLNLPKGLFPRKISVNLSRGEKIRLAFQDLGTTFIKFGQMLSTHPDIIPRDIIDELVKLQDQVPPFHYVFVEKMFMKTFRKTIDQAFAKLDHTPIASASIAQVHTGQLHTGEKVVVKVQRPNLEKQINRDISLLHFFAKIIEKYIPESRIYEPSSMVNEFEKSIRKEVDFELEGANFDKFDINFAGDPTVYFPKIYKEFSNKIFLTMEYIKGSKIVKFTHLSGKRNYGPILARRESQIICKQIFDHGFFHADPHEGNQLILDDGRICFLDAGMVGYLNPETKNFLAQILVNIVEKNVNNLITILINEGIVPDNCDIYELKQDIEDLFIRYYGTSLRRIELAKMLNETVSIMFSHHIRLPSNFILLIRAIIILEGIGKQLDGDFNPIEEIAPYAKKLISDQYKPQKVIQSFGQLIKDNLWAFKSLPNESLIFLQRLFRGKAEVKFDHRGLEELNKTIIKASSRFSASIIIAGMIISSALIIKTNIPPLLLGMPLVGILGFLISGIAGVVMLFSIMKDIT